MNRLLLTFDDGPAPRCTNHILDILHRYDVRAVFFACGCFIEWHGIDSLRRAHWTGHRIGNHTYTHPDLTKLTEAQLRNEVRRTQELLGGLLDDSPLFRCPYGSQNRHIVDVVVGMGYTVMGWDTTIGDERGFPDKLGWEAWVRGELADNRDLIVLAHDNQFAVENLEDYILTAKEFGYRFSSFDQHIPLL